MTQKTPETPLPAVGENDEKAHTQMSDRFKEHTVIEIEKENRLQASEKVWGSVSHALKAVAEQRGWQCDTHSALYDVARQLGREGVRATSRTQRTRLNKAGAFVKHLEVADGMHKNFYENQRDWPDILDAKDDAQVFIDQLDAIRDKPPGVFRIGDDADQRRLGRLLLGVEGMKEVSEADLNRMLPLRSVSDVGFSPNFGFRLPDKSSDSQDDDNGAAPVVRPRPGNPPQPGGQAKFVPESGQGTTPKVVLKPGKQVRPDAAADTPPPKGRRPRRSQSKDEQPTNVNIRFG